MENHFRKQGYRFSINNIIEKYNQSSTAHYIYAYVSRIFWTEEAGDQSGIKQENAWLYLNQVDSNDANKQNYFAGC